MTRSNSQNRASSPKKVADLNAISFKSTTKKSNCFKCWDGTRYLVLILVTLCLSSLWSNILTFNFTIICMGPKNGTGGGDGGEQGNQNNATTSGTNSSERHGKPISNENSSASGETDYTPTHLQESLLIGAVAVGALLSSAPITHFIDIRGPRIVFAVVGFVSAIATALIPTAVQLGFPYFLVLRAFQGIGYAVCMPMLGAVTAEWATLKQNGFFVSVLAIYMQIAPSTTMPIAGSLCESQFGWMSVYYGHAAFSFILFTLFVFFYRNSPNNHPCVSQKELEKLDEGKSDDGDVKEALNNIPYGPIFKTMAIWAVWVAAIGNFSGSNLISLFSPTYLHKVMGYPVMKTGLSAALPPIFQLCVKVIAGASSDYMNCCPEKWKVRIYNSLGFCSFSLFMCLLAFTPQSHPTLALIFLTAGTSLLGINTGGLYKSATLVSRHYSQYVMGVVSTIMCATMLLVPIIVETLTHDNSVHEWAIIFFIFAGIMFVTNLFFVVFARGTPASWAKESENNNEEKRIE